MAVKRDSRYPGRWTAANADFPLGGPKNRTTYTSKDGSYFDREWIADYEAFYQRLMSEAGIAANGSSDTAPTSQFYSALIIESTKATAGWWNSSAMKTKLDGIQAGAQVNRPLGSGAGQVCEGNDPRLSNAREWIADIVPQSEAEAGTSVTPRKWTAQRVHQAFNKYGVGALSPLSTSPDDFQPINSFFRTEQSAFSSFSSCINFGYTGTPSFGTQMACVQGISIPEIKFRNKNNGAWGAVCSAYHTLNMPAATSIEAQSASSSLVKAWSPVRINELVQNNVVAGDGQQYSSPARAAGVIYTNNKNRPLFLSIKTSTSSTGSGGFIFKLNGESVFNQGLTNDGFVYQACFLVPQGATYIVELSGNQSIGSWVEI